MRDWKGMLKKGAELAKQAKSELEGLGVLEQDRQPASAQPAPAQSPADQAREILGPDHPDPFALLTTEEVARAFGVAPQAVGAPSVTYSDNSAGPSWTVDSPSGPTSVEMYLYADPYDIEEVLGYGDDPLRRLDGVPDRAAVAGDMGAVSRGGEMVSISVSGPETSVHGDAIATLLRAVAERLPDFRQYAARMSAPGGPVLTDILPTETLSAVLGVALDIPSFDRRDNEIRVVWREPEPAESGAEHPVEFEEPERLEVEVTHYLVDPWEKQQQEAAAGSVWAKVAVEMGEAMKEQFAEHLKPVPGPWDEGYLMGNQAQFRKAGRSFKIEVSGTRRDLSGEVSRLATRLGEAV